MPVMSMTGFARADGAAGNETLVWELRSVNGKSLEVRLRLPQGLEGLETDIRKMIAARLSRGNLQVSLAARRSEETAAPFTINREMLDAVLRLSDELVRSGQATPPSADGLLALRGVIDVVETPSTPEALVARSGQALGLLTEALDGLVAAREAEGRQLEVILRQRIDEIERLAQRAEADPHRSPDVIRERLARQVADLLDASPALDPARLHAEAALIATRADIREELDRLHAHVAAARELLAKSGPVGRRLDFLAQEFNRESNTLCSKSNAASLTAIGLELKIVVDQFREQVQNLE